jgi:hypothetical protein
MGFVYAMNVCAGMISEVGRDALFRGRASFFGLLRPNFFGRILSRDTPRFDDRGKYRAPVFDAALEKESREKKFPRDLAKARELGRKPGKPTGIPNSRRTSSADRRRVPVRESPVRPEAPDGPGSAPPRNPFARFRRGGSRRLVARACFFQLDVMVGERQ